MCDWAARTDRAGRQKWESNYQHYSDIDPIFFFFFFFFKIWYLAENELEILLFRYTPYWGWSETPYFHRLTVFDVWFRRQKSSNEKCKKCQDSRNSLRPTFYNAFSQISGHFCHHFYPFFADISVNFNRFLCNFAGTFCNSYGDCPEKLVKFKRVLQKLLLRLMWNLIEYF